MFLNVTKIPILLTNFPIKAFMVANNQKLHENEHFTGFTQIHTKCILIVQQFVAECVCVYATNELIMKF